MRAAAPGRWLVLLAALAAVACAAQPAPPPDEPGAAPVGPLRAENGPVELSRQNEAYVLFAQGVRLQLARKHHEALQRFEQALQLDPGSASILFEMGECHRRMGNQAKAVEYLGRSLKLDPEKGPAHQALGWVYLALGRRAEAIRSLERAARAKKRPDKHEQLCRQLAWLHQQSGDRGKAIEWLQFTVEAGYREQDIYLSLGALQLREKRFDDALESFREVARRTPSDKAASSTIARAFARLNDADRDEAIRHLEAAAERINKPDVHEVLAMAYKAAGRDRDALRALERAAQANSRRAAAQKEYLAEYYEQLREYAKAIHWRRQLLAAQRSPTADAHVRLANLHVKHLQMPEAIAAFRKALALEPDRRVLLRRIADCHARLYQWKAAAAALEELFQARKPEPRDATVLYRLGELHQKAGAAERAAERKQQAFDLVQKAMRDRDPRHKLSDAQLHLLLAELYYTADQPEKALDYIIVAQQLEPDESSRLLLAAAAYKRVQKWTAAAQTLRQFLATDDKSLAAAGAWLELADCLESTGDLDGATKPRDRGKAILLKAYRESDNEGAQAAIQAQLGELELRRSQFQAAIEHLLEAVRLRPQSALVLLTLGQCYELLGDWSRAAAYYGSYLESLQSEPDHADARRIYRLGVCQARSGQGELGRKSKERAIALLTGALDAFERESRGTPAVRAQILRDLAGIRAAEKQFDEAIDAGKQAAGLAPDDDRAEYRLSLAAIYDDAKRHADAEALLQQTLKDDPDNPAVLNHLGYHYAERGKRLDESIQLVERALHYEPLNGAYIDSLGWAYYQKGDHQKALELLLRAVQYDEDAVIRDHIGDAYHKLGKTREAREQWLKALTLDPDIEGVAQKLQATKPHDPGPEGDKPEEPPQPKEPQKPPPPDEPGN